ncbi:uncharacterized protein LOC143224833 isoform X2 [Tachypleus tridentatus]|uniref:uncharacterized protein LOC143224833 isoform X2 n=1 Tax=Tachypleus tridentatus TaxID=6853 RepID=UPI003FD09273
MKAVELVCLLECCLAFYCNVCSLIMWLICFIITAMFTTLSSHVLDYNKWYHYHYVAEIARPVLDTSSSRTSIFLACEVIIAGTGKFLFEMKLNLCSLTLKEGTTPNGKILRKKQMLFDLSLYPLYFLLDEHGISEVFINSKEEKHSVNLKKGILSAFNVLKVDILADTERIVKNRQDLYGTCSWKIIPTVGYNGEHVRIVKNMFDCSFESSSDLQKIALWTSILNKLDIFKESVSSSIECSYEVYVQDFRVNKITCFQDLNIQLSVLEMSKTRMRLQLNNWGRSKLREHVFPRNNSGLLRSTLLMKSLDSIFKIPQNSLNKILSELTILSQSQLRLSTLQLFQDFVVQLRLATDVQLLVDSVESCQFFETHRKCTKATKDAAFTLLKDALFHCCALHCTKGLLSLVDRGYYFSLYELTFMFFPCIDLEEQTDHQFLLQIMELCQKTHLQGCWLSLGNIIRKLKDKNEVNLDENKKILEILTWIYHNLDHQLNVTSTNVSEKIKGERQIIHLLTILKVTQNIGDIVQEKFSEVTETLLKAATNKKFPVYLQTWVIQALERMNTDKIYKQLCDILKDAGEAVELRISIYKLLFKQKLENDLFFEYIKDVIKNEDGEEFKSYVAWDIIGRINELQDYLAERFVLEHGATFYSSKNVLLERLKRLLDTTSFTVENKTDFEGKLAFVHSNLHLSDILGVHWDSVKITSDFSYFSVFNVTVRLFEHLLHLFEIGTFGNDWKTSVDLLMWESFFEESVFFIKKWAKQFILFFSDKPDTDTSHIINDKLKFVRFLQENIKNWHQKLFSSDRLEIPLLLHYLKLLGKDIGLFAFQDVKEYAEIIFRQLQKDKQDLYYNTTRILELVDLKYRFSTIIGWPLLWKFNALLGVSPHFNFKLNQEKTFCGSFFLQPSAGMTVTNQVMLDIPYLAWTGIQSNQSLYMPFQWKFTLDVVNRHEYRLSINEPRKEQEYFKVFHTIHYIKFEHQKEVPQKKEEKMGMTQIDNEKERSKSKKGRSADEIKENKKNEIAEEEEEYKEKIVKEWCTSNVLSAILGRQTCYRNSLVEVGSSSPFSSIITSSIWSFISKSYDNELDEYNVIYTHHPSNKGIFSSIIKLFATDSLYRREMNLKLEADFKKREGTLQISAPQWPWWKFYVTTYSLQKNLTSQCYSLVLFEFTEGKKYKISYSSEKSQKRDIMYRDETRHTIHVLTDLTHKKVKFQTPHSIYSLEKMNTLQHRNKTAEIVFSYESLDHSDNLKWLVKIFPLEFWDEKNKIWVKLRAYWEEKKSFYILTTPNSDFKICVTSSSVEKNSLSMKIIHVKRLLGDSRIVAEILYLPKKLLGTSENVSLYIVYFPEFSWILTTTSSENNNGTLKQNFWNLCKVTGVTSVKKILEEESSQAEQPARCKYRIKLHVTRNANFKDLKYAIDHLTNTTKLTFDNAYVRGHSTSVSCTFSLPDNEVVQFQGVYKKFESTSNSYFRSFYEDSELLIFPADIIVKSHSHYGVLPSYHQVIFTHKSTVNQISTGRGTVYDLEFDQTRSKCAAFELQHNFLSSAVNFSSSILRQCKSNSSSGSLMFISINTASEVWDMLNSQLQQVFDFDYPGGESMNFSHPLLSINVTARWNQDKDHLFHEKNAIFTSETSILPSMIWNFSRNQLGWNFFISDKETVEQLFCVSMKSNQNDNYLIYFGKVCKTEDLVEQHFLKLSYVSPFLQRIYLHGIVNREYIKYLASKANSGISNLMNWLVKVLENEEHKLNQILVPVIKSSVAQCFKNIGKKVSESKEEIQEYWLKSGSAYQPWISLINNLVDEKEFITSWLKGYLPDFVINVTSNGKITSFQTLTTLLTLVPMDLLKLQSHSQGNTTAFSVGVKHIAIWEKLVKATCFILPTMCQPENNTTRERQTTKKKIAVLCSTEHISTFDGESFSLSHFWPNNCAYLLAHDLWEGDFSVILNNSSLLVVTSEGMVELLLGGNVLVNGSVEQLSFPVEYGLKSPLRITKLDKFIHLKVKGLNIGCHSDRLMCAFSVDEDCYTGVFGLLGNIQCKTMKNYLPRNHSSGLKNLVQHLRNYEMSGNDCCVKDRNTMNIWLKQPLNKEESCPVRKSHTQKLKAQVDCNEYSVELECSSQEKQTNSLMENMFKTLVQFCDDKSLSGTCHEEITSDSDAIVSGDVSEVQLVIILDGHTSITCSGDNMPRQGLENLLNLTKNALTSSGFKSIKYALVGFGGKGVYHQPHLHSYNGSHWMSHHDFVSLWHSNVPFLQLRLETNNWPKVAPIEALDYLVETVSFKKETVKMIWFITDDDNGAKKSPFFTPPRRVMDFLNNNDITLYSFFPYSSLWHSGVVGVKKDGLAVSNRHPKESVETPSNAYIDLTFFSGGVTFSHECLYFNVTNCNLIAFMVTSKAKEKSLCNY